MNKLLRPAKQVADFFNDNDNFVVVGDYDTDGITSSSIICHTLTRLGKKFAFMNSRGFSESQVSTVKRKGKHLVLCDFGSGQTKFLNKHFNSFAIIDHHKTLGHTDQVHFNAHLFGVDGSSEICAAGMAYVASKAVDKANVDLAALAIVGCVGDMQDASGKLIGVNRSILRDGVKAGVIEYHKGIRISGKNTLPLLELLTGNTDTVFPGLTGNRERCSQFLKRIKLNPRKKYANLTLEEKVKLRKALIAYGKKQKMPSFILKALVGEVFTLTKEKPGSLLRDARDYSELLNACGRWNKARVAMNVCLGDRGKNYDSAVNLLERHRTQLEKSVIWAMNNSFTELSNCYAINAERRIPPLLIGSVASLMYGARGLAGKELPIVAIARQNNHYKVSGRGTWDLVNAGLDLGAALRQVCKKIGGNGGGHTIAAGATIPVEKKDAFFKLINEAVGKQLR